MVLSRALFASGALVLAALTAWAGVPYSAPVPDEPGVARIQRECDAASRLRITTIHGLHQSDRLAVDAGGLRIPAASRPALVTVGDVSVPEKRFPWADVIQLESERSNARRIALLAGLVTLVPMAVLIARGGTDAFQTGDHLVLIFGIALVGAASATGALIGATNPDLHRIYP